MICKNFSENHPLIILTFNNQCYPLANWGWNSVAGNTQVCPHLFPGNILKWEKYFNQKFEGVLPSSYLKVQVFSLIHVAVQSDSIGSLNVSVYRATILPSPGDIGIRNLGNRNILQTFTLYGHKINILKVCPKFLRWQLICRSPPDSGARADSDRNILQFSRVQIKLSTQHTQHLTWFHQSKHWCK